MSAAAMRPSSGFSVQQRSKIPEEVVQRQLDLLSQFDVQQAFAYNSENNQALTGPWKSFAASLAQAPFRPILGHSESTVLMTISHDEGDYVCCLVKVVPSKAPLSPDLRAIIEQAMADDDDEDEDDDDDDFRLSSDDNITLSDAEDDEDDDDDTGFEDDKETTLISGRRQISSCFLYWWEVSKQYDNEENEDDYYYLVDSLLPDAEDLELDYMETTLFAITDEEEDEDNDGLSDFLFDF